MPTSGRRERSTGEPHAVSRRLCGPAAPLSAGSPGADREDPRAVPDETGGTPAAALGRAGNLRLDLEGVRRGGRADPRDSAVARGRRADLLHDVQPPPHRKEPAPV